MENPAEVIVAVFNSQVQADSIVTTLKQMNKNGAIKLIDAAIVSNDDKGKANIKEIEELTTLKGGERGAVVGGILGIIFPPAFLASAAVGAVAGGLWGKIRDTGFKSDELKTVANELKPGEYAVVAVLEDVWVQQFVNAAQGYQRLFREALDANVAAVISADPVTGDVFAAGFSQEEIADPPADASPAAEAPATDTTAKTDTGGSTPA